MNQSMSNFYKNFHSHKPQLFNSRNTIKAHVKIRPHFGRKIGVTIGIRVTNNIGPFYAIFPMVYFMGFSKGNIKMNWMNVALNYVESIDEYSSEFDSGNLMISYEVLINLANTKVNTVFRITNSICLAQC